ncbi:hypothetical protein BUMB_04681c [Candidatus Paraburkholderia calva]|nr:hypothetical protein BUMB_04681c [Candidatus Paraburkholderia calva]
MVDLISVALSFIAETNPDAPQTVAAFLKLLSYTQKLIHVRWSGEGCWVPLSEFKLENDGVPVGFENHTSHPSVGDVLFYLGGYSETEIIVTYGSCLFASKMGQLAGNHFLTIVEGKERLRELGVKTLWEGAQDIVRSGLRRSGSASNSSAGGEALFDRHRLIESDEAVVVAEAAHPVRDRIGRAFAQEGDKDVFHRFVHGKQGFDRRERIGESHLIVVLHRHERRA